MLILRKFSLIFLFLFKLLMLWLNSIELNRDSISLSFLIEFWIFLRKNRLFQKFRPTKNLILHQISQRTLNIYNLMIYLSTWMCHFVAMTLAWYITISCILFIFSVKTHDYVLDIDVPALFLILKLINGLYLKLLRNSVSVGVAWLLGKVILKVHF